MRVTLKDIATKVGVTKTAVSLALRGNPGISEAMRAKIRRVAAVGSVFFRLIYP